MSKRHIAGVLLAAMAIPLVQAQEQSFPPAKPLRVHITRGLWSRQFRLEEALAARGGAVVRESWDSGGAGSGWLSPPTQGNPGWVWWHPSAQQLMQRHLLIVCHVHPGSFHGEARTTVEYVKGGGSVLFLGGRFALGAVHQKSPLAAITPADFPGKGPFQGSDLVFVESGTAIRPGPDAALLKLAGIDWSKKPFVFWYHKMTPKPGAKVVLTAATGDPLLVVGKEGKGTTAVFAGTVMGDPAKGRLPFWQWDQWPSVLGALISHLTGNAGARNHGPSAAQLAALKKAVADVAGMLEDDKKKVQAAKALFEQIAWSCHTTASLHNFAAAAVKYPQDIPLNAATAIGRNAWMHTYARLAGPARKLIASGQLGKTILGLYLLGASRKPGTEKTLARFWTTGAVTERNDPDDDDLDLGDDDDMGVPKMKVVTPQRATAAKYNIQLAALSGLGNMRTKEAASALRNALKTLRGPGRVLPEKYPELLTDENRLYQQCLVSLLRCGDAAAAKALVRELMENVYVMARARMEKNKVKERIQAAHAQVSSNISWQQHLYLQLNSSSETALPALARAIAAVQDRRVAPLALAVLADRKISTHVRKELAKSPVPGVAALARSQIFQWAP